MLSLPCHCCLQWFYKLDIYTFTARFKTHYLVSWFRNSKGYAKNRLKIAPINYVYLFKKCKKNMRYLDFVGFEPITKHSRASVAFGESLFNP